MTQDMLADLTRQSRESVNLAIAAAIAAGALEKVPVKRNGRVRACQYRLIGHEDICRRPAPSDEATLPVHAEERGGASGRFRVGCADTIQADCVGPTDSDSPESRFTESLSAGAVRPEGEGEGEGSIDGGLAENAKRISAGQAHPLDPAWMPSAEDIAYARARRPDLSAQDLGLLTEKLTAHYRTQPLVDAAATWRRWVLTEKKVAHHDRRDRPAARATRTANLPAGGQLPPAAGARGPADVAANNSAAVGAFLARRTGRVAQPGHP